MASADLRKTIEATIREFLASYEVGAAQNDPSLINRSLTLDCKRHLLPQTMLKAVGIPLDYAFDNATYEAEFAKDLTFGAVQRFEMDNLVIDVEARKAAATATHHLQFKVGNKETILMEFSWFFDFIEDGTKISKVVEFVDNEAVQKMVAVAKEAGKTLGDGSQ